MTEPSPDDFERLRARVHNQSDRLERHELRIGILESDCERLRADTNGLQERAITKESVTLLLKPLTDQIGSLKDAIEKIESNIVWGTRLVVGAVIVALIAMVMKT